jgi:putative ABC transport system permease protein
MTKSKRYILLITISALLTYALVFFLGLLNMFHSEKSISLLGGQLDDIELDTQTKAAADKIMEQMKKDYGVEWTFYRKNEQLIIDDQKTTVQISDDFDSTGQILTLEGRHPKHDNEIAISTLLKDSFGKGKGEYLAVKDKEGNPHQFLITGIFQTIDNDGRYVRMHESGMKALFPGFELNEAYIKLKSHDNLDVKIAEMQKKYTGYDEISNERTQSQDKMKTIKSIFSSISTLIFVLTVILIGFIILLIMKITVYNESKEFGIYKAVGFSSLRLRLQLTLRFMLITLLGSIIGAALELLTGSQLFTMALKTIGIASFRINLDIMDVIIPILFIMAVSMLSAFITSRNTKKVSAYALINE